MTRLAPPIARGLTGLLFALGLAQAIGCASTPILTPEFAIEIQAQLPAPPLPDLSPVPQPPPPRVTLEGERLSLDEALSFDEAGALAPEHADILAALATWLSKHPEAVLRVETHSVGKGSKRAHAARSAALAQQIVDALAAEGVDAQRLLPDGLGKSKDDARHVSLKVTFPAPAAAAKTEPTR